MVRETKVNELSPRILFALETFLTVRDADAIPLLTAAQRSYSSDFWLNFSLAGT